MNFGEWDTLAAYFLWSLEDLWSPISPYLLFVQAGIQGIEPGY